MVAPTDTSDSGAQTNTQVVSVWYAGEFAQVLWDRVADESSILGYNIYRLSEGAHITARLNDKPFPIGKFVDTELPAGETIKYTVTVVGKDGIERDIGVSNEVRISMWSALKAADARVFDKNNIITVEEMTQTSTMSLDQIQQFLTDQGGYLARYTYGGKTAAKHIFNAAQNNSINPQVILATLQKEWSLITDKSPTPQRLAFAMGWLTASNFGDQVANGAKQFRSYLDNLGKYGWTVGKAHTVNDGTITAVNTATAGLYAYTPWIGKGAGGGGPYGYGGNYLFWQVFYAKFAFGAPLAPSEQSALGKSKSSISVSWTDNSNNETKFTVRRWNGSKWVQVSSVGGNVRNYIDTGLKASTEYLYNVCAENSAGTSCAVSYATGKTTK